VAREVKDVLLKYLGAAVPDTFLAALGLDLPRVVEVLPTDVSVLEVRPEQPDLLLRLADGTIAHIEFQTTTDPGDLERFYHYQFAICERFKCLVYTIVVYGPWIKRAATFLDRGSAQYRVRNVYLGQRDAEALVERLQARAAAGELWNAQERVEAILLPLMGRKRPLPVLLEAVAEASAVLPIAERTDVLGSMVGLAYNYLDPGLAEQLLEVLRKMNAFEQLLADQLIQGRAQGRAEGRAEGERAAVIRILQRRFGTVPDTLVGSVAAVQDLERVTMLVDAALEVESLDAFVQALQEPAIRS
jgi:hypothetical protein